MIVLDIKLADFIEILEKNESVKTVSLFYQDKKLWEFPKDKAKTARGTRGIKNFEFKLYSNGEARIIHGYDFTE